MVTRLRTLLVALALLAPATGSPAFAGAAAGSDTRVLEVDSLGGVAGFFNLGQGAVRIVALVSPTSPECATALDSIAALFSRNASRRLRAYVIFMPMLEADAKLAVLERVAELPDRRIVFFWNENRAVGDAFGAATGFDGTAWNAYALYDTDATFGRRHPGVPDLWMHPPEQIGGAQIESGQLSQRAGELLDAFEKKRREAQKSTE